MSHEQRIRGGASADVDDKAKGEYLARLSIETHPMNKAGKRGSILSGISGDMSASIYCTRYT